MLNLIVKVIIFSSLLFLATPVVGKSSELNRQKVIKKILKMYNKKMSDKEANKIAYAALETNRKVDCKAPWDLIVSIAIVESSLNTKAYNKHTRDYGIMQINEKTISRLKLNKARLMNDVSYSFATACKIITENKAKYEKRRPYWVGIYNAGIAFDKPSVIHNAKKYDKKIKTVMKDIYSKSMKLYALEN